MLAERDEITTQAEVLLDILQKSGEWMSRDEIAAAEGKKKLTYHERNLLQRLIDAGLIEVKTVIVGISTAFRYRALPQENEE